MKINEIQKIKGWLTALKAIGTRHSSCKITRKRKMLSEGGLVKVFEELR